MNFYLKFRKLLKSVPILFFIYSRLRCARDVFSYFIIRYIFKFFPESSDLSHRRKLLSEHLAKVREIKKRNLLHIYWIGNDYHQDFSGFIQSLQKFSSVTTYKSLDEYGQVSSHHFLDRKLRTQQSRELLNQIVSVHKKRTIHVVMMQTWGFKLDPKVLQKIKEITGCLIINIGMDDKHSFFGRFFIINNGTFGLRNVIDYHLSSSKVTTRWFEKLGVPSIYFPEASCPAVFFPVEGVKKVYDVGLIGSAYGVRKKMVRLLKERGLSVQTYGDGWPDGRIENEQVNLFYNQCRIVLGVGGIGHCLRYCSLKLRDFDVPMSGALYLTSYCEDLESEFVIGSEVAVYYSMRDLIKKVQYYLSAPETMEQIATAGRKRALAQHTYDERLKLVFGNSQ